jgi:hypothetical protein
LDVALQQSTADEAVVVRFVAVHFVRALPGRAPWALFTGLMSSSSGSASLQSLTLAAVTDWARGRP